MLVFGTKEAVRMDSSDSNDKNAPLWRRMEVFGSALGIQVELSSVPEDVAQAGASCKKAQAGFDKVNHFLTWDQLMDGHALQPLFQEEKACVWQRLETILDVLRKHRVSLFRALAE